MFCDQAAALQFADETLNLFQIAVAQRARIGQHLRILLQAAEQRRFLEWELQLGPIQDVHDDDLVPLVPQMLQTVEDVRQIVEKIAENRR